MNDFDVGMVAPVEGVGQLSGVNYQSNDYVSNDDVAAFEAEMLAELDVNKPSFTDQIVDRFSTISEDISLKKEEFEYKLARAAETGETSDVLDATRAMADYQLQVEITTKIASKTNASIEKITNLQ